MNHGYNNSSSLIKKMAVMTKKKPRRKVSKQQKKSKKKRWKEAINNKTQIIMSSFIYPLQDELQNKIIKTTPNPRIYPESTLYEAHLLNHPRIRNLVPSKIRRQTQTNMAMVKENHTRKTTKSRSKPLTMR